LNRIDETSTLETFAIDYDPIKRIVSQNIQISHGSI